MCESSETIDMNIISLKDIRSLLAHFSKHTYRTKYADEFSSEAMQKCIDLMKMDYSLFTVSNANGELCGQYPSQLIILEYENSTTFGQQKPGSATDTIYENLYDASKLRDLFSKAKNARCRGRFPVPVIFYKGKYVCRSATLSGGPEIYGRSGLDYLFCGPDSYDTVDTPNEEKSIVTLASQFDWQLFNKVRTQDINLLKSLNVGTIVDFMVEKKKVKYGVNVTSSEKVDKENRYVDFKLISLPYPGCEFFKHFRDNNYIGEGLVFDWSQSFVDANISVPEDSTSMPLHIDWNAYRTWDIIQITQNYLKLILKYLQESNSGVLIHCISGWDRTPLFVSLIRLSLWADGLAHQSLDAQQIVYLTIAYDWMLFGHHLSDRFHKGEDIFFCCFNMLKYLTKNEFGIAPIRHKTLKVDRSNEKTVQRMECDPSHEEVMVESDSKGSEVNSNSMSKSMHEAQNQVLQYIAEDFAQSYTLDNYLRGIPTSVEGCAALATRSPQARRTSPVPILLPTLRQRQESSSSLSTDSWQVITGTGSVRGSDSASESNGHTDMSCSQDSNHTADDDGTVTSASEIPNRARRLSAVREIFIQSYAAAVGLKFNEGDTPFFGSILGSIAEKVGLINN